MLKKWRDSLLADESYVLAKEIQDDIDRIKKELELD